MTDITLTQGEQLPAGTKFTYKDMGDGTHALVLSASTTGGDATEATLLLVKAVTDAIPDAGAMTTISTDTARLTAARAQILTDWINGGRLDLILDEILSNIGAPSDAGSLTLLASLFALARKAAKESWEADHHNHTRERWLGLAGASEGWAPYALPVANGGNFGAWTEILDAADTPIIAGSTHYDPHRVLIVDVPQTKERLLVQFAWGAVAATAYGDGDYTEVYDLPEKPADGKTAPLPVRIPRLPTDTLLWARAKQENADAADGTVDFFLGIHEYTDPDV